MPALLLGDKKWTEAIGPMRATILTIDQLGWKPIRPNVWLTHDKEVAVDLDLKTPDALTQIRDAIEDRASTLAWAAAGKHFLAGGTESGVPFLRPAREARRYLVKERRFTEARALDAVVTGSVWTHDRGLEVICPCWGPRHRMAQVLRVPFA